MQLQRDYLYNNSRNLKKNREEKKEYALCGLTIDATPFCVQYSSKRKTREREKWRLHLMKEKNK